MGIEIRKYDKLAREIYELQRCDKKWPHFNHLLRKERDYYRALAQVAETTNSMEAHGL